VFYGECVARFAFLGTPEMAVGPLRALVAAGHDITLCITRPDRRRGRGGTVTPSPVKEAAVSLGIAVSHSIDDVAMSGADLAVVVAYGRIIPQGLLNLVPMVNLHFSLLPRWRGAAPVERAILAGDHETGVCLMRVEAGLDTGPVYARRVVPVDDEVDLPTLQRELVEVGSALLVETLARGVAGLPTPRPQQGEPTIAAKVTNEDLHLHWEESAAQLNRVVRLGRAWTSFRDHRLGIVKSRPNAEAVDQGLPGTLIGTSVVTGQGTLSLLEVQPESRSPMPAEDWLRGIRPTEGERLGSE
jgi:methionyl-tRNA formyltransferase